MPMLESQLVDQNDQTITIKFTNTSGTKEYLLTVVNHPDYTEQELLERWTRRAKREYMTNRPMFQRMFIDRINRRHQKIVAGEIPLATTE